MRAKDRGFDEWQKVARFYKGRLAEHQPEQDGGHRRDHQGESKIIGCVGRIIWVPDSLQKHRWVRITINHGTLCIYALFIGTSASVIRNLNVRGFRHYQPQVSIDTFFVAKKIS